ncbi:hypothetical protein I307_01119 [Cryptococcus deuterogattii 99/473]|uniref:C3H1-type domain-containing protein n=1 Tax=Cryptococcus deuterogattii Ram5 TaxID=1296110 RepID=A0A0D0V8B4_9TREE|nr:hypothetical protein I309_01279 [Cryptococcus deuterogattii LA55]KIR42769.1 hypothetical protein I313_00972 [Cryptococcus deuterogattii Ram5]KIR95646.1 hypothetical protein I304_00401 [Cryptococcus deuterogattii CBS 10090]KIS02142.1 hypothetical protein L804_00402 [Cryptococcus deuterogattii 2001/935-1]KIY59450.1 hypothetical protein I307_01119 [Cryptococcus deuterogattii 99/473]
MAVESVPVQPQAASPNEVQIEKDAVKSASDAVEEKKDEVEALQEQIEAVNLGNVDDLHAACVEGNLQDVRVLLSKGTDRLETLDVNSGCTPIVLAIRANHHDIVRELLAAGAIIPPPGLTNDPLMLSILYPQPVYGMPPQFMSIPPQDFYPQPNYFPSQNSETQQFPLRKDSASAPNGNGSASNLPPAEVSKSIPCRNFPNCKYGNACVFLHPRPAPFYPGPGQNGFAPQGYEGYPPYPPAPAPYFMPNGNNFQSFASSEAQPQVSDNAEAGAQLDNAPIAAVPTPNGAAPVSVPAPPHVPSAVAPVFIPGYQPADMMGSPPPPPFGLSPMSPSMLGSSLPSIPPAEVFFATSPTNGFMPPVPMTGPHARRQSFGQGPQFGGQGKPFGHGKKPSFSSGKPWTGNRPAGGKFGNWKDGNPPPCAFFSQGNCRNGEFCKFPHLDADGNDCQAPTSTELNDEAKPAVEDEAPAAEAEKQEVDSVPAATTSPAVTVLPAKPAVTMPTLLRSASQPGVQRVHANGVPSRSHSPAPSNVSFHGNGHPRRAGRVPNVNGTRSSSSGPEKKPAQRVPKPDEFPVLGTPTSEKKEPVWGVFGKTAAQVLQAPAPVKPVVKVTQPIEEDAQSVTMESESDSDTVLVSHKSSAPATPASTASPAPEPKKAPISFASIAGAVAASSVETAPVAVKA